MKIDSLEITRRPSYDNLYPNMLVGMVQMSGIDGAVATRLSNKSLAKIFEIIRQDVMETAKRNAADVRMALDDAENENKLLENQTGETDEGNSN